MNDTIALTPVYPDHPGLFDVAAEQAGYFTTGQARAQGFSAPLLTHHVKAGRFIRVSRGVYRLRDYPSAPREELMAAWLRLAPDAAVSHQSALDLFGLSDLIPDAIHLSVPRARRRLARQHGVRVHTTTNQLDGAEVVTRAGLRVTSPARSIIDVAEAGAAPEQVQAAIRQAIGQGLTTPRELQAASSSASARVVRLVELAIPGPAVARYATAQAFRRAIETRISASSRDTGLSLSRLRKEVVFARLLARLGSQAPGRWVLKGGLAMAYRFGDRARSTRDVDLAMTGLEEEATRDLVAAGRLDAGDYFVFAVERTDALDPSDDAGAVRYHVRAELAGRVFDEFVVDVGFDYPESADIELVRGPDLLGFAGLPVTVTPTLSLERQVAEKVHAYTRGYGAARARTTRVKDLVDIDLVASTSIISARRLRMALEDTFATRSRQSLPAELPRPPSDWRTPFAKLAREISLPMDVDGGFELAATFIDPVLDRPNFHATWRSEQGTWEPRDART